MVGPHEPSEPTNDTISAPVRDARAGAERSPQPVPQRRVRFFALRRVVAAALAVVLLALVWAPLSRWTDRSVTFLAGIGFLCVLLIVFEWAAEVVLPAVSRLGRSLVVSLARAVAADAELNRMLDGWPRVGGWVRRRFSLDRWTGLYLTCTSLVTGYFLAGFVGIGYQALGAQSLGAYDPIASAALRAFRTPGATRVMWAATVVGDPWVATTLAALATTLLLLRGKREYALLLASAEASAALAASVLKFAFHRPRPSAAFALIQSPASFSYPSGHALTSIVFFGTLAYIGVRTFRQFRWRFVIVSAAALGALLVGASRVYLGVHWLTDVVGGWALGLAWLTLWIGVALARERYARPIPDTPPVLRGRAGSREVAALLALALALTVVGALRDPILARATSQPPARALPEGGSTIATQTLTPVAVTELPRVTDNPDGAPAEPVGVIFVGSRRQLVGAFRRAGWSVADPPTLGNVLHEAVAAISDKPYATAPVTPAFLGGQVHDIAFEKPEGAATVRRRHHARFWLTRFMLAGAPVWVGTASFDERIEIGSTLAIPTHHIDPQIDAERDLLVRELVAVGAARETQRVQVSEPVTGRDAEGDPFFTQGQAAVLVPTVR